MIGINKDKRRIICFISSKHTPYDKRVFHKEAVSLGNAGYDVIHVAPNKENKKIVHDGINIHCYKANNDTIFDRIVMLPKIIRVAQSTKADCYHCNEPDSWIVGLLLKVFTRTKVVFDVHEHYPSRVAENYFPPCLQEAASNLIRILFNLFSKYTDGIVFAKNTVANDFPEDINSVFVYNYTVAKELDKSGSIPSKSVDKSITAIHIGLMSKKRGWPQLIDAVKQLDDLDIKIHIAGTFIDKSQAEFKVKIQQFVKSGKFIFEPWMPFQDVFRRLLLADIGLILFQPGTKNHEYALPHKMFDYMLAGLPVIVPKFAVELRPIIEEERCGILVDTYNPEEIAAAIRELYEDQQMRKEMGRRGRTAVLKKYNWENEEIKLIRFYRELFHEDIDE